MYVSETRSAKNNIYAIKSYCNCGFKIVDNDSDKRFFMIKEI